MHRTPTFIYPEGLETIEAGGRNTGVIRMRYCIKRKHWMKNNKGWSVTIMDQELKKYVMQFYGMKAIEEAEQWLANHN